MTKKEAIEVIKTTMPYMWKETKEAIQTLIPEFAESDDERIRKELIAFVKFALKDGEAISLCSKTTKEDVIAYLEKQKEQKPINYDHEMRKNCEVNFEGGKRDVINNPEKYGLCKHSEWSDEDKDIINEVVSILINDENRADNKREEDRLAYLAERIQSIHPQPKQEWSEEDDKMLWSTINGLNQDIYEKERNWLANRFKSLRPHPHWRPSKEQIDAIHEANYRCRSYLFATHLTEIEIQLEKLMNE